MRLAAPFLAAATLSLLAPGLAHAGGVGPLVMGGFHTETLTYYSSQRDGGEGRPYADIGQYERFEEGQLIANVGGGLEFMLGDRDDMIQGVFRGFYMLDGAQTAPDPNAELVDADALVVNFREDVAHLGVGTVGINIGVVRAANDKFKFSVAAHLGAAFASIDQGEFFLGQVGGNIGYQVARTAEIFVDVSYGLRIRKELSHGLYGTAGVRFLFD